MARGRQPLTWRQRARLFLTIAILLISALTVVAGIQLKGLLGDLSVSRASNTVNRVVMVAVGEAVEQGDIRYEQLISFEKDDTGHITALKSNMAEFNRLQSAITQEVLQRLSQVSETDLSIPLGNLTGCAFLAGRGPRFTVRMQSVSSCSAKFENVFTNAGINQTTHSVLLHVDVSVSILLPGFRTSTKVQNTFAVAETVIVGDVPQSYTYFHSDDSPEEQAKDYTMNNA